MATARVRAVGWMVDELLAIEGAIVAAIVLTPAFWRK